MLVVVKRPMINDPNSKMCCRNVENTPGTRNQFKKVKSLFIDVCFQVIALLHCLPRQSNRKELLPSKSQSRKNQGARRRKQSSPQGLHRDADLHPDSESTFPAAPSNGESIQEDVSQEGEPLIISTTTKLLQGLREKENEIAEPEFLQREDEEGAMVDGVNFFEDEEDLIFPVAQEVKKFKDDEDEDWKSSEISDDSADADYGKPTPKRKRRPRKKPAPKVAAKIATRTATKASLRVTKSASTQRLKSQTTGRPRGAPRGRRKPPATKVPEKEKPKPKEPAPKRGPRLVHLVLQLFPRFPFLSNQMLWCLFYLI